MAGLEKIIKSHPGGLPLPTGEAFVRLRPNRCGTERYRGWSHF